MQFNNMTKQQLVDYLNESGVKATLRPRKEILIKLAEEVFEDQMKAAEVVMEEMEEVLSRMEDCSVAASDCCGEPSLCKDEKVEVMMSPYSPEEKGNPSIMQVATWAMFGAAVFIIGLALVA